MACRKVVCQECATEWDGINYCVSCLAQRGRAGARRSSLPGWIALLAVSGLLFYASVHLMAWAGVFVMSWR